MSQHPPYRLVVAAGPSYDKSTHQIVEVNGDTVSLSNEKCSVQLAVRVKDYNGLPESSPAQHPYFEHDTHKHDTTSITFGFELSNDVNGDDLVFGNDFDHSLKDRLPMGFSIAMNIVKTVVDPNIDGDVYAEKPYLYSPGLATWSQLRVGSKDHALLSGHDVVEEGASDEEALGLRKGISIPATASGRKKHFQTQQHREAFTFQAGRGYLADFSNAYINFSDLSLNLPGFRLPVHGLVDRDNYELRYVLKHRKTGEVYFVVVFILMPFDDSSPPELEKGKNPYSSVEQKWEENSQ